MVKDTRRHLFDCSSNSSSRSPSPTAHETPSLRRISGKKNKQYEQMQKQIDEEIEDDIVLADEEYQRARAAHSDIVKKRKLQNIRKVR